MAQTYTRQSSFADGDTVTAALFNDEYNQLVNAFAYSSSSASSTGHRHDGTAGQGGNIHTIGDLDFLNKIVVDDTNNRWGVFVEVSSAAVEQIRIQDGAIVPVTDSDIDLGTTGVRFKDAYIDSVTTTGNVAVGGNLTVTGTTTFNGGTITMGDAATDNVVFGADIDSNIIPDDDDSYDLGSSSQQWKDLYIDGTANIDSLVADTADINGGTVDGAIIGGSSAAAITGTTITGTSFVIGSADISEAELETIDGVTAGTVAASKAIVVDSNKDFTGARNITLTGELDAGSLDVSGDVDVDGTLETDALSINGTAVTSTAAELNILDGVTSTAAELNILDGVTSTAAEINILDGVTSTAAEINVLDGITSTVAELNILDGVTASATDINLIDGITNGTVIASKAIITDSNKDISGGRNITISGELDAGSLDVSGDADIDGTLEADAITIGGVTLAETISDTVGAMVSSNTETNITVTYQDSDNTLDFAFSGSADTTGNAATATALETARTIHGVSFDGTANIDLSEVVQDTVGAMFSSNTETNITATYEDSDGTIDLVIGTLNQDTTGLAATATALATARTIHGVSFDGTANIDLSEVVQDTVGAMFSSNTESGITVAYEDSDGTIDLTVGTLNQNTTGSAATLTTARTIGGVSFDGSANIVPTTFAAATFSDDVNIDSGLLFADVSANRVGINQASPDVSLDLGANTDAVHMPTGNTAQRPGSPAAGYFRYNSETAKFEGYTSEWGSIAGGGSGTNMDTNIFAGDGSDTTFTLSTAPDTEQNLMVFIDGVFQAHDSYSVSGTTLTFSTAPANGRVITAYHSTTTVGGSNNTINTMTGDNSDTTLTLSVAPVHENNVQVYFDGVYQSKSNYSISGTTLTFSTAPPTGVLVEAITNTNTSSTTANQLLDADGDTMIQVEESSDEDKIRFDTGGSERGVIDSTGLTIAQDLFVTGGQIHTGNTAGDHSEFGTDGSGHTFIDASTSGGNMFFQQGGATKVTISSGNVGIGTTSPDAILEVDGSASTDGILITNPLSGSFYNAKLEFKRDGTSGGAKIQTERASAGGVGLSFNYTASNTAETNGTYSEAMRILSTGQVSFGTSSPIAGSRIFTLSGASTYGIQTQNDATTGTMYVARFLNNGSGEIGSIKTSNSVTAFNTSSDYRLKENVDYTWDATTRLKQLKPARFNFIADETNTLIDGFLAHEVASIVPEAISGEKDAVDDEGNPEYQGIDQSKLVPLLTKAIQEQQTQIEALQSEINKLKGE